MRSMASDRECSDLQSSMGDSTSHLSYSLQKSKGSEGEENINALKTVDLYKLRVIPQRNPRKTAIIERLNNTE